MESPIRPALSINRCSSKPSSRMLLSKFSDLLIPARVSKSIREETKASENCSKNWGRPRAVSLMAANPLSEAPPAAESYVNLQLPLTNPFIYKVENFGNESVHRFSTLLDRFDCIWTCYTMFFTINAIQEMLHISITVFFVFVKIGSSRNNSAPTVAKILMSLELKNSFRKTVANLKVSVNIQHRNISLKLT